MNKNISIMTASIAAAGILTLAVLAHAAFAQDTSESDSVCDSGNFVTKVIFLPDPTFQSDPPKSQSLAEDPPNQSTGGQAMSACQVVLVELEEKVDKPELTSSKIQTRMWM